MPEENPLKGVLFGRIRLNAFPLTQEDALAKAKEFEERLHPRGQGGKFAPKGGGGKGEASREASREFGVSREWQDRVAYHGREMQAIHNRLKKKDTPELRVQFRMHDAARRAAMEGRDVTESMIRANLQGKEEERVYNEKFAPKRNPAEPPKAEKPKIEEKPKLPALTPERVKSEAEGVARELGRVGARRGNGGWSTGKAEVTDVLENPDGSIDLGFYVEGLKIGGPDDIDSNDGEAQRKLHEDGKKMLENRLPGAKVSAMGGEKGDLWFNIEGPKAGGGEGGVPARSGARDDARAKMPSESAKDLFDLAARQPDVGAWLQGIADFIGKNPSYEQAQAVLAVADAFGVTVSPPR